MQTSILNRFSCNFADTIGWYYGNCPVNLAKFWIITAKVIDEICVKFDWVLLKVIHLDVNSDVNSQPFSMSLCRHHRLVLRQLPCKFGDVWLITAKVINEIGVKFDWVLLKVIHLDVNLDVNSQLFFYVILQAPSAGITAKFD